MGRKTVHNIQYLRGFAALAVVLFHAFPQLQRMGYVGSKHAVLSAGVDIFFVVSGFIMWETAGKKPDASPRQFMWNRIRRIVPLYWILTTFIVAIAILLPKLLQTTKFNPQHVAMSYMFIAAKHPVADSYAPVLIPGWTLNYEMFFYVLFAGCLAFIRAPLLRASALVGGLVLLTFAGKVLPLHGIAAFYTDNIVLEFAFGIGVGVARTYGLFRPSAKWILVCILGTFLLAVQDIYPVDGMRALVFGLPSAMIVFGAVGAEGVLPRGRLPALERLGDASYALYLSHFIVMSAVGQVWRRISLSNAPWPIFVIVSASACVCVGFAIYQWLEKPITAFLTANVREAILHNFRRLDRAA